MKRKSFERGNAFRMNLQLFAEAGDGAGTGEGEGGTAGAGDPPGDTGQKPKTFDEILSEGTYKADFDRKLQEELEAQRSKLEVLFNDKATEAEKLARMTKEEKAQYMQQKQEKDLKERETAITRRELMAEAKNMLAEKNIPAELSEVLNYTDADSCSKSIEAIEKAFQKAVEQGVQERLKGGTPIKKAPQGASFTREQVAVMSPDEINSNWDSISKSMETWNK